MKQYNYKGQGYETLDELFKVNIEEAQVSLDVFKEKVKKGMKPERAIKSTNVLKNPLIMISVMTLLWFILAIIGFGEEYYNMIAGNINIYIENNPRGFISGILSSSTSSFMFLKDSVFSVLFFIPDSFFEYITTVIENKAGYVLMWLISVAVYTVILIKSDN